MTTRSFGVSVNGGRHDLSLQRKCAPSMWNRSSARATGKKEQIKALNAYLDKVEARAHEAKHFLICRRGWYYCPSGLVQIFNLDDLHHPAK
jgi:hypothetical protein